MLDLMGALMDGNRSEELQQGNLAGSVLGTPYSKGASVVIPLLELSYVQGGDNAEKREVTAARPVALIIFDGEKVRVETIMRVTPVALAGILLAGWNVYWITRTIREWHARK
jgi:hypothetical protein